MATNESIPLFDAPEERLTGNIAPAAGGGVAVVGKTFAKLAGDLSNTVPPSGPPTLTGGNPTVATAGAGDPVFGVFAYDAPAGGSVTIHQGANIKAPVTAGAAITAGQPVKPDAQGRAIPAVSGDKYVGRAMNTAASGAECFIDRADKGTV